MTRNQTLTLITSAILCTDLTGCGTIPSYEQLGNGYVEATYTRASFSEPSAHRTSLQYRKGWHTVVIWPSTRNTIVNGDLAVFVGNKACDSSQPNGPQATEPRLFAMKAPDLLLDITDEVLWRWSKQSGEDFTKLSKKAYIMYPKKKGDALEFQFAVWTPPDWPTVVVLMDWNQISDVMREVREKGVVRKDRVWGTSYIEKEFKPETTAK